MRHSLWLIVFDDEKTNYTICEELLKQGVIVRNLVGFGLPNCMRVTIGLENENHIFKQAFLKVIKKVVQ